MKERQDRLKIPFQIFKALLISERIEPRGFGKLLFDECPENSTTEDLLSQWQSKQSAKVTLLLDEFLSSLKESLSISRVSLVEKPGGFHTFILIRRNSNPENPVFFLSYNNPKKELLVTRYETIYHFAGELKDFITPGPPLLKIPFGLCLPAPSFMYLCALTDLYRRRYYASLLDHTTMTFPFFHSDIVRTIQDARTSGDMRWLLPHIFSIMPGEPGELLKGDLTNEISWLLKNNYLIKGKNQDDYDCSDNCKNFLKLLTSGNNRIGITNFHQDTDMGITIESVCIIRAPRAIIAVNIGIDNNKVKAVLSTLNFEQLLDFTIKFLSAGSAPPPSNSADKQWKPPSSFPDHLKSNSCPSCHAPIPPNAKFCRKCGKPIQIPQDKS